MSYFGFPIEVADEPPAPETGVYRYGHDVAEDGTETIAEAAQLTDGRWYLRVVQMAAGDE